MEKFLKRAWAEVHLDRLETNLNNVRKNICEEKTQIACVIKANAYGHDDKNTATFLENTGVRFFAVSNIYEAIGLRANGIKSEILILGYTPCECVAELAKYDIIQAAISEEYTGKLAENAQQQNVQVKIHFAVDTGMGRIGAVANSNATCRETAETIVKISQLEGIVLDGVFTPYAVADSYENDDISYTTMQTDRFFKVCSFAEELGVKIRHKHCLNSAGGLFHYDERSTLLRLGIVLYGLKPDRALKIPFVLAPVMELKSVVSCVRKLEKGSFVSYGRTYCADKTITVATIPIGYADGYPRALSGKAHVLINGKEAPILGRICMDQLMADVSGISDVSEGDVVTLIGYDHGKTITADDIAEMCGTIGYEIVCGISKRIPRVIYKNDEIIDIAAYT